MRQQVNFTVEMIFDADASLSADDLQMSVNKLLHPIWEQGQTARTSALVLIRTAVSKPIEEAELYSNDEPEPCPINRRPVDTCPDGCTHGQGPTIQPHTVEALRKAMAEAPADPRTGAAFVNIDTRVLALLLP